MTTTEAFGAVWDPFGDGGCRDEPLGWDEPRRAVVGPAGDLFGPAVPGGSVARVFAVMALADRHTFQVVTSRPERMRALLTGDDFDEQVVWAATGLSPYATADHVTWPLPNVWMGVHAPDQAAADERVPWLLSAPAAARFVWCEPLLGPVDLSGWLRPDRPDGLDWVVVGGETGPGARPAHPGWVRGARDQCAAAATPFFFAQWGPWAPAEHHPYGPRHEALDGAVLRVGERFAGRRLDGRTWDGVPTTATAPA